MLFVITHWKALQCPQSGRLLAFADVLHGYDFDGLPWKGWSRQLSDERSTAAWPLQAENRTACLLTRVGHALGNRKRFFWNTSADRPCYTAMALDIGARFLLCHRDLGGWELHYKVRCITCYS